MIDLEKLQNLPFRSRIKSGVYRWQAKWRSDAHSVNGLKYWKRVDRNIENNIGKSFDMAFHYYCKQVPKYQQKFFLDEFHSYPDYCRRYKHYIDDNGNIQAPTRVNYKRPIIVRSIDYRVKYRLKKIKHLWDDRELDYLPWWVDPNDYEKIVYGQSWQYENRRDPGLRKYNQKRKQEAKVRNRKEKVAAKTKSLQDFYDTLRLQKIQEREHKNLDMLKRCPHSYDPYSYLPKNYKSS